MALVWRIFEFALIGGLPAAEKWNEQGGSQAQHRAGPASLDDGLSTFIRGS